jgi:RHS repeat-associated protein
MERPCTEINGMVRRFTVRAYIPTQIRQAVRSVNRKHATKARHALRLLLFCSLLAAGLAAARPTPGLAYSGFQPPAAGSGAAPWDIFTRMDLSGRLHLRANAVNGNLLLDVDGLALPGVNGFTAAITLHYNSFSRGVVEELGNGWLLGTGSDVHLTLGGSSATFYDETGHGYTFSEPNSCSFTPPPGIDAALACTGTSGYTLTKNASQMQYQFNSGGYLTALQNRQGNRITFAYDSGGTRVTQITNTEGQTIALSYDSQGRLTQIVDPSNRTWTYSYDSAGNLSSIGEPGSYVTTFGYDSNHTLTQITDPRGTTTLLSYNATAAITQIVRNRTGPTWTFTYSPTEMSSQVTDPNNHTTTYAYNSNGLVTAINDPELQSTVLTWTSDYHVSSLSLPSGEGVAFSYDSHNNLTVIAWSNNGPMEFWDYGNPSFPYNPSSFQDAQGNTTAYGYNSQGLLNSVTDAANHTTSYSYNADGTLASMTDPNGHVTSYSYTSQGLLSKITSPSPLGAVSFTYNSRDLLASRTDGKGQVTKYSYSPLDQPTTLSYGDGSQITYSYDANGNRLTMGDSTGTTTYAYNALNQLTQTTLPGGSTVAYTWDGVNNLLTKADGGGTVTYTYTPDDEVASVADPQHATTNLAYDADRNLTQIAYPDAITQTLSYNKSRQLTKIAATNSAGTTLTSYSYSYANPSNVATLLRYSVTDVSNNTTSYTYDALNRLIQAVQKNGSGSQIASYSYGYDPAGNMTSQTINGSQTSLSYNAANELTAAGSTTYSFDANGNETGSSAGLSLSYNAQDQTTSATPPGGGATSFSYTDQGQTQRVKAGSTTLQYDLTGLSVMTTTSGPTYFTRLPNGTLLSERTPSGTDYYLGDGLGSVAAVASSTGSVVNSYSYDPFGNTTSATEKVANPFRFDGQYLDQATGFYKMGARYYVPTLGRWTQEDALMGCPKEPQSLNRYSFVRNDPVDNVDPTGSDWSSCFLGCLSSQPASVASWLLVAVSAGCSAVCEGFPNPPGCVACALALAGTAAAVVTWCAGWCSGQCFFGSC